MTLKRNNINWRNWLWAGLAILGLVIFYILVLRLASGSWWHVISEIKRLWYWLILLLVGFGIQVGLMVKLRGRAHSKTSAVVGTVSTSTSTGAMIACCAHHLVEVLPILGFSGIALWLTRYQIWLIVVGLVINLFGIVFLIYKLRQCRLGDLVN